MSSVGALVKPPVMLTAKNLADPTCGTPGRMDILLEANTYSDIILQKKLYHSTASRLGTI